jgi:tetratricopeptide (TPR) repeat protein
MRFVYDNSSANPRNPHQPPRRVVWGQNTSDEMGDLWMQLVPRASSDYAALNVDAERKRQAEDLAAYTKLVREDPRNPLRRDTLGTIHLRNGRLEEAAAELRASLTLNPDSAPTHYNLGLTLASGQKFAEAAKEFSEAIRLAPDHAQAHNNLGAVLHFLGNLEEAGRHYRQAVSLRPDNVEAVNNLARLLVQQRRPIEAVELFGRALAINQDFASALAGLAWLRSTSETSLRNGAEAVGLAERADRLTGHQDPSVLDALAAAYAEVGRFDRAVEVGREARAAAERAGLTNLASEIGQRLELYQRKQPYRAP